MIIELKDIPAQPIKKLDIHIEFSENGITVTSLTSPPQISKGSKGSKGFPVSQGNTGIPVSQDNTGMPVSQDNSKEPSEIPQEMLNADF